MTMKCENNAHNQTCHINDNLMTISRHMKDIVDDDIMTI